MRTTTLFLLLFFTSLVGYSQVEKMVSELPDFAIPNLGVVHTIKIEIVNNSDKCKQIFLRNDKKVTGIDFSGSDFTNPVTILAEYGDHLYIDMDS